MNKYYLTDIESLLTNPEEFKNEAISSLGILYYFMEKNEIFPSIDFLLDTINSYSIRFIYDNYQRDTFTSDQQYNLDQFIMDSNNFNLKYINKNLYNFEDLLNDIRHNVEVSDHKKKLFNVSFKTFYENKEILIKLIENQPILFASDPLIDNVVRNTRLNDLLSVEPQFLIENSYFLSRSPLALQEPSLKKIYKQSVIKFYKNNNGDYRKTPQLNDFIHYTFEKNEKDFLESLLKDEYSPNYKDLIKISGATKLFSKIEFFEKFNLKELTHFSDSEIIDNTDKIRKTWLNHTRLQWENFASYKVDFDTFQSIVTPDYLKELIEKRGSYDFILYDRENQEQEKKANYLNNVASQLLSENHDMLQYMSIHDLLKQYLYMYQYHSRKITPEYQQNLYNVLDKRLSFFNETDNVLMDIPFNIFTKNDFFQYVEKTVAIPSVNYLYFLLSINESFKGNKNYYFQYNDSTERLPTLINDIASQLEKKEVAKLMSYFKYDWVNTDTNKNNTLIDLSHSLFNYKDRNFYDIPKHTILKLLHIDPDFRDYIITHNFKIMTDNTEEAPYSVVGRILHTVTDVEHPLFPFLKTYITNNSEDVLKNYYEIITQHTLREHLIKFDTQLEEINNYKKIEPLLNKYDLISNEFKNNENDKQLEVVKKQLKSEIDILIPTFSHNFTNDKIAQLLENKQYTEASLFYNQFSHNDFTITFNQYIKNMPYDDFNNAIDNIYFIKFLSARANSNSTHEDNIVTIINPTYTYEENASIAYKLKERLVVDYDSERKNVVNKVLNLFSFESKVFAKEFIVKNDPFNMFYSYDFMPADIDIVTNKTQHIHGFYTNEEIINGLNNLIKSHGHILNNSDNNAHYEKMLKTNFSGREDDYKQLLAQCENNPVFYLLMSHHNIFVAFIGKEQGMWNEQVIYFEKNFKLPIVLEGLTTILKTVNEQKYQEEKLIHNKPLQDILSGFINATYNKDSYEDTYFTTFNLSQSLDMVKAIWFEAPLLFITKNYLGSINNVCSYIADHFEQFYYDGFIENFLLGQKSITYEGFTLSQNDMGKQEKNIREIFDSLINYLLEHKKDHEIDQVLHLMKEHNFNNKNIVQNFLNRDYIFDNSVITHFCADQQYDKLLDYGRRKYLLEEKIPNKLENKKRNKI